MKENFILLFRCIILVCTIVWVSCIERPDGHPKMHGRETTVRRIVSLAPSITEIVFELGLEERLVGVTDYCLFPPAAKKIRKMGGYLDPDFESLLSVKPDLILLLGHHDRVVDFCRKFSIGWLVVENNTVAEILESITSIGARCGRDSAAATLRGSMEKTIEACDVSLSGAEKPRVLLCIGRGDRGSGAISNAWFAGKKTIYNELITIAGGENAIGQVTVAYPQLAVEGIIQIDPDIIIDIVHSKGDLHSSPRSDPQKDWKQVASTRAMSNGMFFALAEDYLTIPGPRIFKAVADFSSIIGQYRKECLSETEPGDDFVCQ